MEQQEQHAKAKWAETLGVSTSGYYDWLKDRENRAARDQKIRQIVIDLFRLEDNGTYGADRICGCTRRDSHRASYPVVKRITTEEGFDWFGDVCVQDLGGDQGNNKVKAL